MNKPAGLGAVVVAAIIVMAVFLAASFVLMFLVNVIIGQYGGEPLTFGSALAATALLGIFGGAIRGSDNK